MDLCLLFEIVNRESGRLYPLPRWSFNGQTDGEEEGGEGEEGGYNLHS